MIPPTPRLSDRRTAWCAALILLCLLPLAWAAIGIANTSPGPGGERWGPVLGFVASYAVLAVLDVVTIALLAYSLRKNRILTPARARWTIWLAVLTLLGPAVFLGSA
ncbi:hypothetical protein [Pseudoduganella buxea]|uniref:Uncharacterized protein n=1 Tax=Pseudoduganella buxea TaxID=1949069 RepID=A0A6I3SXX2_9BURK|nr:hypothetical protein [Pseudoduganella buxea]MTV53944.1 hypothetical protein [Pseudoduganella buxea]GGC03681.1 hypothetical protein GCM10011572_27090 [Pseudoduganella buxea]